MQLTVKLFATLRNDRFKIETMEFEEGSTIAQVAQALNIPEEELALTLVNGILVKKDNTLKDGDTLAIFPPVGGG